MSLQKNPDILQDIIIRPLTEYSEFLQVQRLHQSIWGLPEGAGIYPPILSTMSRNGGIVLRAFYQGVLVGFLFGFLGRHGDGQLKLCSQTMGLEKSFRGIGIGTKLKLAQRDFALQSGLSLITWTFDPLEATSALLNLHKLRAISRTYLPNLYGENFSAFNAGLPSDRLVAEWWLESPEVKEAVSYLLNSEPHTSQLLPQVSSQTRLVDIHRDFQMLRHTDPQGARELRYRVRDEFVSAFTEGYVACDFWLEPGRGVYVLSQ